MKNLLLGLAILPFAAGVALAAQPLTDKQMDKVTAGHVFSTAEFTNSTYVLIDIEQPVATPPTGTVAVGTVVLPAASMVVQWGIIP
jgi:hypothetical protein